MDPDDLLTPEYPDEGQSSSGLIVTSQGCTNYGAAPCNCVNVVHAPGNGLHVISLQVSAKSNGNWTGRWKYTRNGSLFVRSPVVQMYPNSGWEWDKDWYFNDGDELCGGFWLSTGGWFNAPDGPACKTVHS